MSQSRMLTRRRFLLLASLAAGLRLVDPARLGASALPIVAAPPPGRGIKTDRVVLSAAQLATGALDNMAFVDGELRLAGRGDGVCRSATIESPFAFTAIGTYWRQSPGTLDVSLRVSVDGARWSEWQPVARDDAQRLEPQEKIFGTLLSTNAVPLPRYVQCSIMIREGPEGQSARLFSLALVFIEAGTSPTTEEAAATTGPSTVEPVSPAAVTAPPIISRTAWGCPDGQNSPRWTPVRQTVTHLFIHHTVSSNSVIDWAAEVRNIWAWHANGLSWGDIGYNFLVDPLGNLYEGRAGGDDVIAGHTYGYNSGTLGLAFLGTFNTAAPPAAMRGAAEACLAWKASQRCIDPTAYRSYLAYSGCSSTWYSIPTLLGHRDAPGHNSATRNSCNPYGTTECPGDALWSLLPSIRGSVRDRLDAAGGASISEVKFTPQTVTSGDLLRIDITVVNNGCSTLTTQGPSPGFVYEEGESFKSRDPEVAGSYRVAVEMQGRTQLEDHPYRWGLGSSLAPGASVTVTGYVRLLEPATRQYWAGLVHEGVRWVVDGVGGTTVTVVPGLQATLNPVTTTKTWFVLTWQGSGGTGVLSYTLERSDDGVNWSTWIGATAETRALFVGAANRTYYLRLRATDSAGSVSAYSQITVHSGADSSGLSATALPEVVKNR